MPKQKKVDELFSIIISGNYERKDECEKIRQAIKEKIDIDISVAEAGYFWKRISKEHHVDWISIKEDKQIVELFKDFYKKFWNIKK